MLRPYMLGFRRNQAQPVNPLAPTLKIRARAQIPARVIPLPIENQLVSDKNRPFSGETKPISVVYPSVRPSVCPPLIRMFS